MKGVTGRFVAVWHRARKLRWLLAEPQYRRALRYRVAASIEHERTPLSHDYRSIIDVGANRGQFALLAARRFPNASLTCFEPQARPRRILSHVMADHPRVRLVDHALAASSGTSVLHITHADDSSSLLQTTKLQVDTFPGTHVVDQLPVTTTRLDELSYLDDLDRPTLLKIDVQGTELEVLTGARRMLDRVDSVLVECSFVELYEGQALADEVISFLHGHGFRLAHMVAPTLADDGRIVQADMVFERTEQ